MTVDNVYYQTCPICNEPFSLEEYVDCPDCDEQWEQFIRRTIARRILANHFRALTPPPDRRRMSTGGRRRDNPFR